LVQELTMLLDSGRHDDVSVSQALHHIREGDVFAWIKALDPDHIDFSMFGADGVWVDAGATWIEGLRSLLEGYGGDIQRKWGIEKRGLCLLLAWTFEILRYEFDHLTEEIRNKPPEKPWSGPDVH
jgi:hypothetical protein